MDALVCNGLGIYIGMKTLDYLSMKEYHWRGMWNIPTYGYVTNTSHDTSHDTSHGIFRHMGTSLTEHQRDNQPTFDP